eukprot:7357055-Karenia_brevis.AAC.1
MEQKHVEDPSSSQENVSEAGGDSVQAGGDSMPHDISPSNGQHEPKEKDDHSDDLICKPCKPGTYHDERWKNSAITMPWE